MSHPEPEERDWRARAAASVDDAEPPIELPPQLVYEVFAHARETHPEECCGLLVGTARSVEAGGRVVRCTNVQNQRKARGESDLDARHGFWIDERELLQVLREAEQAGESLLAIYHSHVNTAAYLSHTDLSGALGPDAKPLWPGAAQLVVSVYEDGPRDAVCFVWQAERAAFVGRRVVRGA